MSAHTAWSLGFALSLTLALPGLAAPPEPLDPNPKVVWRSPDASKIRPRSPGLLVLEGGRLVITLEYHLGGVKHVPGLGKTKGRPHRGLVLLSDDGGETVRQTSSHALYQGRPFVAGGRLYFIGHHDDLGIMASDDRGETWGKTTWLTQGQDWHQAPCNVHYANGRVYLVMERHTFPVRAVWPVHSIAPVVLSAPVDADLTQKDSWTFSNELTYTGLAKQVGGTTSVGVPFHKLGATVRSKSKRMEASRPMAPPGWLETHLVSFPDPDHVWHDPAGKTLYLIARAHTGRTNLACVAKAVEGDDGKLTVQPALAPSGKPMLYLPLPGGHLKFHIVYDAKTKLFWLVSNQSTDSMTRPDRLGPDRYMLPDNERHRLALHFSKNCVDWIFAGLVDKTDDQRQARSYASMAIDGDDLLVLARSGDGQAPDAHEANLLTLHRVRDFRRLVY